MTEMKLHKTPRNYLIHEELMRKVNSFGGFFDGTGVLDEFVNEIYSHFDAMTQLLAVHPRTHIKRPIYTELINNEGVNAFCYASSDENHPYDFIGINVGAVASVLEVCNRLLSLPFFLPDVGNSELEQSDRTLCGYWHESSLYADRSLCIPNDSIRAMFANELAMKMVAFIYFHEAAHLNNGHLEFIASRAFTYYMLEKKSFDPKLIAPLIRQTLEMDADAGAIEKMLIFSDAARKGLLPTLIDEPNYYLAYSALIGSPSAIVRCGFLASVLFYRLFQDKYYNVNWGAAMQENLPWPSVPMREHLTCITLIEVTKRFPEVFGKQEQIAELMFKVKGDVEKAMAFIEERDASDVYLSPLSVQGGPEYLRKLLSTWKEIRPDLVPNVRRGSIAAAQD